MDKNELLPGDVISTETGSPVIEHQGAGFALIGSDRSLFIEALRGNLPVSDYVAEVDMRARIGRAYFDGGQFPVGTLIQRPQVTPEDMTSAGFGARVLRLLTGRNQ